MITDHKTLADAVSSALQQGLDIDTPHYLIERIEGSQAYYNTNVLTGYYLWPSGLIQKSRVNGEIVWTLVV